MTRPLMFAVRIQIGTRPRRTSQLASPGAATCGRCYDVALSKIACEPAQGRRSPRSLPQPRSAAASGLMMLQLPVIPMLHQRVFCRRGRRLARPPCGRRFTETRALGLHS